VNNPNPSTLAADFLEYVQGPEVAKRVAFAEGTYNPVAQMGNEKCFSLFDKEELDAIQWDTLEEEMAGSIDFDVNPDYDEMYKIYLAAKRKV
jgi:spermidine/putrescine transport system substrate-binding protein